MKDGAYPLELIGDASALFFVEIGQCDECWLRTSTQLPFASRVQAVTTVNKNSNEIIRFNMGGVMR